MKKLLRNTDRRLAEDDDILPGGVTESLRHTIIFWHADTDERTNS